MSDKSLKISVFCCSNGVDSDDLMRNCQPDNGDEVKAISLPCSGKLNLLYLIKAFEGGADGVMVVTCPKGTCQYLEGNLRAEKRVMAVDDLNEEIGLGRGRISVVQMPDDASEIVGIVNGFLKKIGELKATVS